MKAAVYYKTGAPGVFKYEEVPDPQCGPYDVLIDVKAVAIEGGDVLNRAGGEMVATPHCVGYQASGLVRQVGENIADFEPGQRVATVNAFGSHAAKRAAPAATSWVIPDDLSFEEAACVPITFGTADECLFEFGRLKKGETVLIQAGAGGVGMAAIQLAKRAGARVLATASSDERLERLKALGMDEGINYRENDLVKEVKRLTDNSGVNLVVDPVGGEVLEKSIASVGYRGRVITVGSAGRDFGKTNIDGIKMGNQSITGVFLGAEIATERVRKMIDGLFKSIAAGELKSLVDRKFPLEKAADAHVFIESRQAVGRVVLIP
ncbi:MAG: zinc-binding alcohol dehydrogenase family protein [Proteobacteria bacterium]|nr:zinc-binding alcohol dehydrogenase family protein [Pseudomonadota bacterium]